MPFEAGSYHGAQGLIALSDVGPLNPSTLGIALTIE
jgi:hypothetical protein